MAETIGDFLAPEQKLEDMQPDNAIATIGHIYADGITLFFDGSTTESQKRYKCNTNVKFLNGARVKVVRLSGTFVVEYMVGNPKIGDAPGGGTGSGGIDAASGLPSGGATGQYLRKNSSANYDASWADAPPASAVKNQSTATNANDIQFRTTTTVGTTQFQIRSGESGAWKTINTG